MRLRLPASAALALLIVAPRARAESQRAAAPGAPESAVAAASGTAAGLQAEAAVVRDAVAGDRLPEASDRLRLLFDARPASTPGTAAPAVSVPEAGRLPRYNEVYRTVTHNSYWVKRSNMPEAYASGAQERLLDQLLFEHVRGLEIDIHKNDLRPGQWSVYHTDKQSNVLCSPFDECLKQLQQLQYALPKHEVVTVVIELKEILGHNWDKRHTPRDFDALLEKRLGKNLYRPKDLLARCRPGATLRECVREKGWPTTQELRGKFMFAVLGNWRWCTIGHGGADWAEYATWNGDGRGGVESRSAWPMASDYSRFNGPLCGSERVPAAKLKAATDASALLQVEEMHDPKNMAKVGDFLKAGGVVRAGDTYSLKDQRDRIAWGAQMFQTDYPWLQANDRGPEQPFRPLDPRAFDDEAPFREPGERLAFSRSGSGSGPAAGYGFAAKSVGAPWSEWETVPSSTRPSPKSAYPNPHWTRGKGCLRAEGEGGTFALCRQTVEGQWYRSKPLAEDAVITVETLRDGKASSRRFVSGARTSRGGVGDMLRLTIERRTDGTTCAQAYSASEIGAEGRPKWTPLSRECFSGGLRRQGVSAQWGDVLFVNTRNNGAAVKGASLSSSGPDSGYRFADLSVR